MTFHKITESEELEEWMVLSHSSNTSYLVSKDNEGYVFCSCPQFIYRLSKEDLVKVTEPEKHCKHLQEVLGGNQFGYKNTKIKKTSNT